ncbi:MAG: HmuY family protein [Bacteroidales bacterium]|nr:HmuY family protein [Bacteroidales bacterium]
MKTIFYIALLLICILFSSCFEDDERVVPIEIDEIEIPYSMYEYQTYYSISDKSIVSYHNYEEWDLGFESSESGFHIILNSARFMYAGNTFQTDFNSVNMSSVVEMVFDHSSGDLDSTVLNEWVDLIDVENPVFNKNVYIIDRGKNELGEDFGSKKIVFEKMESDTFYIHYANLDNTEESYFKIPKNENVNFVLFSFDNLGEIKVSEPEKSSWDICFTKYSTIIPDDDGVPNDYLVRGVFLNPYKNIEVALDTLNYYYEITSGMINEYDYSSKQDAIGYDWKVFNNDSYTIRDYNSYILKNVQGVNYKLRFTQFYNDAGIKGYPAFELLEL